MKWDNAVFISELVSMLFFTLMALQTFYIPKKFKLEGMSKTLFNSAFVSIALMVAIAINKGIVGWIGETNMNSAGAQGFVNPSAALMIGIATNTSAYYSTMWVGIIGNMLGGLCAGIFHGAAMHVLDGLKGNEYAKKVMAEGEDKFTLRNNIIGETFGSLIFFTAIIFAVGMGSSKDILGASGQPADLSAGLTLMIVGFGLFVALLSTTNYGALLNPAVGLGIFVSQLISGRKKIGATFANYSFDMVLSFGWAAAIGGATFALSLM